MSSGGGGGWESRIYFYMQYDQNYTENPCTKEKKITKYIKILKYVCLGDGETAYSICSVLCFLTFRISVHDFYNICLCVFKFPGIKFQSSEM